MRIGLISDTHLPSLMRDLDELGPQLRQHLTGVDLILHGGDVVGKPIVDWCEQFAPTLVARGNNDIFDDPRVADVQRLDIEGWRIGMVHELRPEHRPMPELLAQGVGGDHVDILIAGDTHVERLEYREGVVFVNSGSPTLPHHKDTRLGTIAMLEIQRDRLHAEIIRLGDSHDRPNPGVAQHMEIEQRRVVAASRAGVPVAPDDLRALQEATPDLD